MTNPQDTTAGTLSLVFGILGCVGILPCIGAILGIVFGNNARGTAGESSGKIGKILGWLGLIGPIIAIGIYVILALTVLGGFWWTYI